MQALLGVRGKPNALVRCYVSVCFNRAVGSEPHSCPRCPSRAGSPAPPHVCRASSFQFWSIR